MAYFQNVDIFITFYLTILGFPFALGAVHFALDAVENVRIMGKRDAVAPVAVTV